MYAQKFENSIKLLERITIVHDGVYETINRSINHLEFMLDPSSIGASSKRHALALQLRHPIGHTVLCHVVLVVFVERKAKELAV